MKSAVKSKSTAASPVKPAAAPVSQSPAPPPPSRFIHGPRTDLALIVGAPLWVVPLLFLLGSLFTDRRINDWVAALGAIGHHVPGLMRAYGDKALFARFRVRFILAPILLVAWCVLFSWNGLHNVVFVAFVWGVWHAIAQSYGFVRIYGAKAGVFDKGSARTDLWLLATWFIAAVSLSPLRLAFCLDLSVTCGLPLPSAQSIALFRGLVLGAAAIATIAWLVVLLNNWRLKRRPGVLRIFVLLSSIALWWFANWRTSHLLLALPFFELFHDAQYLSITWIYNHRRASDGSDIAMPMRALFRPAVASIALFVVTCFAYGAISFYRGEWPLGNTVIGIVAASQLLHFYYDGFIWKVREPQTAGVLGMTSLDQAAATRLRAPVIRHAMMWTALFVVPCAALWYGESNNGMPYPDRILPVADLVPENALVQFSAAELRWTRGEVKAALDGFRHVLAIDPTLAAARNNLALSLCRLADAAMEEHDVVRLRDLTTQLSELSPALSGDEAKFVTQRLSIYRDAINPRNSYDALRP